MGEENKGMRIMFEMMNEARLFTGMQGAAHAGRHICTRCSTPRNASSARRSKNEGPESPQVRIIEHPDVRRMLMFMKSSTEGLRALLYLNAYCIDRVRAAETEEEKELFQGYVDLIDPNLQIGGKRFEIRVGENHRLESRMRETRLSGLEGGGADIRSPYPY